MYLLHYYESLGQFGAKWPSHAMEIENTQNSLGTDLEPNEVCSKASKNSLSIWN